MYKMVPKVLNTTSLDDDCFLNLQIQYKNLFEKYLMSLFDFENVDDYLCSDFIIPVPSDTIYNFYHKYSKLGSNYIYLRNNIHIERLNLDEIRALQIGDGRALVKNTYKKVLTEGNGSACYGTPLLRYIKPGSAIIFEFAYNDIGCDVHLGHAIEEKFVSYFQSLSALESQLDMKVDFIINDGFDNSLRPSEDDLHKLIFLDRLKNL